MWELHPSLIFSNTLITGGDTGSHLAVPAYLKSVGNPFNLTPWTRLVRGHARYTYYFVLPDLLAWFGSYIVGFAIAFKLATILGSVLMPVTAYMMGRLFKARVRYRRRCGGDAALPLRRLVHHRRREPLFFDGGEYAFALSLALSLLTIGLFARACAPVGATGCRDLAQRHARGAHLALVLDHRSRHRRRDLRTLTATRHRRPQ